MSPSKLFNERNLKCLGKREENGVSTPHVLSMRSYAHIQAKYAKTEILVKSSQFTLLRTYAQPIVKEVMYINMLEPIISYTLSPSNIITDMNKSNHINSKVRL